LDQFESGKFSPNVNPNNTGWNTAPSYWENYDQWWRVIVPLGLKNTAMKSAYDEGAVAFDNLVKNLAAAMRKQGRDPKLAMKAAIMSATYGDVNLNG